MFSSCSCALCSDLLNTTDTLHPEAAASSIGIIGGSDSYATYGWRWGGIADVGQSAQVTWSFTLSATAQPGGSFDSALNVSQQAVVEAALERWEEVCGIDFVEASTGATDVDLRFGMDNLDGPYSVLGQAHFTYETTTGSGVSAAVRFDSSETWSYTLGTPSTGQLSFYTVALHEIGHAIGLRHSESAAALMAPTYNASLGDLQPDDIAAGVYLYGDATSTSANVMPQQLTPDPVPTGSGTEGGYDTPTALTPTTTPATGGGEIPGTSAAEAVTGRDGDDTITGAGGNDTLSGGVGTDVIYGNADNDLIYGNQGNDQLFGGQGLDIVFGGRDADVVYGNLAKDAAYGNLGNDTLFGGLNEDELFGGQGDDALFGNADDDVLNGNLGNDILSGGAGRDTFAFGFGFGSDTVTDFNIGNGDRIHASGAYELKANPDGSTLLDFGGGNTISLAGILSAAFQTDWVV